VNSELLGPEASFSIIEQIRQRASNKLTFGGVTIEGYVDLICREQDEIVWEVHQTNLLTDYGRRMWMNNLFYQACLFTSGIGEVPMASRYSLIEPTGFNQVTAVQTPVSSLAAGTKTWSYSFGIPAANRTVASVGLCSGTQSLYGATRIMCYSLISPPKIQTTQQTLEISYRLTMIPNC
jgi:hypothetical protein